MKTPQITRGLLRHLRVNTSSAYQFANHHIAGWSEADVWDITESNLMNEYEIKVSLGDFRADFNKTVICKNPKGYRNDKGRLEWVTDRPKHDVLQGKYEKKLVPTRFSFVCPEGLISPDMLPEKYGLYYAVPYSGTEARIKKVVAPKPLNKNKATQEHIFTELRKYYLKHTHKDLFL